MQYVLNLFDILPDLWNPLVAIVDLGTMYV